MDINDVSKIKAEQDRLESRKKTLFEEFVPFRTSFLDTIGQFLQDGQRIGLKYISPIKLISDKEGLYQSTFTLNGYNLLLVSSDEMYFINIPTTVHSPYDSDLYFGLKVCIYINIIEDPKPTNEIIIRELPNNQFNYQAYWFTTEERKLIISGNSLKVGEGIKMADALINHYYQFINTWIDRPTKLAMLNKGGSDSKPMGFKN